MSFSEPLLVTHHIARAAKGVSVSQITIFNGLERRYISPLQFWFRINENHAVGPYLEVFYGECASMYPASFGKNPHFPRVNDFRVVQRSDSVGSGVICYRSFEPGDLVAEFTGKLTRKLTQHSLQVEPGMHLVDLHFVGYLLHSCDPNVSLDMAKRRVYALKPISEFDFLEMDYAQTEDVLYRQFPCNCGALSCRGWITGRHEPADQRDPAYEEYLRTQKVVA